MDFFLHERGKKKGERKRSKKFQENIISLDLGQKYENRLLRKNIQASHSRLQHTRLELLVSPAYVCTECKKLGDFNDCSKDSKAILLTKDSGDVLYKFSVSWVLPPVFCTGAAEQQRSHRMITHFFLTYLLTKSRENFPNSSY